MLESVECIRRSVLDRPDGALTLGRRNWLWREVMRQCPADAIVRHAILGHLVCNQTTAAWKGLLLDPTDQRLHHRLRALSRSVLLGELGIDVARQQFTGLDGHANVLSSMLMDQNEWNGVYSLRAVWSACLDVIRPAPLSDPTSLELADGDVDFDTLDPHFLTSCVIAGGVAHEGSSDPKRRRAFWIDWLDKLFPLAFSDPSELLELVRKEET